MRSCFGICPSHSPPPRMARGRRINDRMPVPSCLVTEFLWRHLKTLGCFRAWVLCMDISASVPGNTNQKSIFQHCNKGFSNAWKRPFLQDYFSGIPSHLDLRPVGSKVLLGRNEIDILYPSKVSQNWFIFSETLAFEARDPGCLSISWMNSHKPALWRILFHTMAVGSDSISWAVISWPSSWLFL